LEAALTEVEHDLEDTSLRAPYAGRIATRLIDEGTIISAGTPVFELLDDRQLEAWVGLPAPTAVQFTVGQACQIECGDKVVSARVKSLAAEVDKATRTRMLQLDVGETDDSALLPGQTVRLSVEELLPETGYWVPSTALITGSRGLWSVYVVPSDDDVAAVERRDIELLDTVGEQSFIRGALSPGERIVAAGTHRIVAGQRVRAQPQLTAMLQR
jgi:RND family efflux transporter MFP subunit